MPEETKVVSVEEFTETLGRLKDVRRVTNRKSKQSLSIASQLIDSTQRVIDPSQVRVSFPIWNEAQEFCQNYWEEASGENWQNLNDFEKRVDARMKTLLRRTENLLKRYPRDGELPTVKANWCNALSKAYSKNSAQERLDRIEDKLDQLLEYDEE